MDKKYLYVLIFLILIPLILKLNTEEKHRRKILTPGADAPEHKFVAVAKYIILIGIIAFILYFIIAVFFGD